MAIRKSTSANPKQTSVSKNELPNQARGHFRKAVIETLEQRQLMAVGPRLIGVQPNASDLLENGDVRTEALRELRFWFDDAQVIDAATLSGIRISRSGGDGSFGFASASSDFGTNGRVDIQLTSKQLGGTFELRVDRGNLGANAAPAISSVGNIISITLNTAVGSETTASALVNAINGSAAVASRLSAKINGGLPTTNLATINPTTYSPIRLTQTNDVVIQPGSALVGENPDENEVTLRFAENLVDDHYRLEVLGFDDPTLGIVGLRNVGVGGLRGDLLVPSNSNTRQETIDFRLDLGPQVVAVVPQPVLRVNGQLTQHRDTVVVYFDNDKLLIENDAQGRPTSRSVENPDFYQLLFTRDTIRNTDDGTAFKPLSVRYNASANTATLVFAGELDSLPGPGAGPVTYRLRVGTRETQPLPPARSEASATAITDFNTAGAVKVRFTSKQLGESSSGIQVEYINTNHGGAPTIAATGRKITVDLGRNDVSAQQVVDAMRASAVATSLVSIEVEPGSNTGTIVGNRLLSYSPVTLLGLGSSFDTATNLGVIGSSSLLQSSLILSSSVDPEPFALDLLGGSDDSAHRILPQNLIGGFENHVNATFGADPTAGISTIYYNFKTTYSRDNSNNPLINSITAEQRRRTREALNLWASKIGVQFIETADQGITIALGSLTGLTPVAGTQLQTESILIGPNNTINFGVRIDKSFANSMIILEATRAWNNSYGEDYFRASLASIGMILGLEHAGDLPETTLMRLDPEFMAGTGPTQNPNDAQLDASEEKYEAIFPGNQDILHAQYLHRPDGSDIDLYRFEVDLGSTNRAGLFTLETYAQRLPNASELDSNLHLYKQTQATARTNFSAGNQLSVEFTAIRPGTQGNELRIFLTQTNRGAAVPGITVFPNAIGIDLNSTPGSESTVDDVIQVLRSSPEASKLVSVNLTRGSGTTRIGANQLTQNPIVLSGGNMDLIARNDNYFSRDSLIQVPLSSGVYFVGVSASGNDEYNAAIPGTGFGGQSQGSYELRMTFRGQVADNDTIQDVSLNSQNDPSVGFDGDGDGAAGGIYSFWFQTRPLNRTLSFNAGVSAAIEGRVITIVGANGVIRDFEFSADVNVSPGRIRVPYAVGNTQGDMANALAAAITSQSVLGVSAIANGIRISLQGERSISVDPSLRLLDVGGKSIFVDKSAGPNADGSLQRPFNNIAGIGVPNAFAAALPGDIVRIVGNGGADGRLETFADNFAFEFGTGLLPGAILSDGLAMDVPKGVTTMIDPGAIFKLRGARIGVGSSNLNIDRSGAVLQVLGAPVLLDNSGNVIRHTNGNKASGNVFFTSWLDESLGLDNYGPSTTPANGDWGGIAFRRDIDMASGRRDLEDEGIFLQYVNHADIRYGGGSVVVDSVQQVINAIQMFDTRPSITHNRLTRNADAAISALPNSFEETNFHEPRFQVSGAFTSDYDRVGPEIHHNTLLNNSLNALFVRVDTPADGEPKTLTVAGRFDDIDIVHLFTDNLIIAGAPGGSILDGLIPPAELVSVGPGVGGTLLPGVYNYKLTFVDRNGIESVASNATTSVSLGVNQTAVSIAGIPAAAGDFVTRRLYRSSSLGSGPYELVASLDKATTTYLDIGKTLGGTLARDRANASGVALGDSGTGTLPAGRFNYRIVMVNAVGQEGLASNPTADIVVPVNRAIQLSQLPATEAGFIGRRVYRSSNTGNGPYVLVAELLDSTSSSVSTLLDDGSVSGSALSPESLAVKRPRANASLVIDPGTVLKLEGSRIEATFGTHILAEGTEDLPIIFTSKLDDRFGAGGTFDTNNNTTANRPALRDWGGIYMAPTSSLSLDHARISYGGGVTKLDGTFRAFNTIELHQADARIAHSVIENNADGFGGQGPGTRFGRLLNGHSTIFMSGTQPTIIDNVFRNNVGTVLELDANSMVDDIQSDSGRQRGLIDRNPNYAANRGPLIRDNRFFNNTLNGLKLRGDTLTTASVWDDTDIVHVLYDGVFVNNYQHEGGLRLQSAPDESLVVKFDGYGSNYNRNLGAGITANGQLIPGSNRVGGTLHLLGQPGFPVILTSLFDDTVGAGLTPDGRSQNDTNNDGIGSIPGPADWRGILIDQYANDRNVGIVLETEDFTAAAPGPNGQVRTAQGLGSLAANTASGSENLRLGFVVEGVLSQEQDIDVYSFSADAGSEIWLDVDYTKTNLDMVLELLDASGALLARSDNSTSETTDPSLITRTLLVDPSSVNALPVRTANVRTHRSGVLKEDGTTNVRDPGLRVVLPGSPGARSSYYFQVRSAGTDIANSQGGLSTGSYQVQLRLREQQEYAGSLVSFADIRYTMNGVHLRGMPSTSPLIGEAAEDESVRNGDQFANNGTAVGRVQTGSRPQYLGNILKTANGGISLAGSLSSAADVDFYRLDIRPEDLVGDLNGGFASVVFDIDYADGLNRRDTSINIFQEETSFRFGTQYRLVYSGDSSNIADDQARPLLVNDVTDLSRGSVGTKDAFIGPIALQHGTYLVAVSSAAFQPRTRIINQFNLEPINSVRRIVDEDFVAGASTALPPIVTSFLPQPNATIGATGELVSKSFDLGKYSADDLPATYIDYEFPTGGTFFNILVKDSAGQETQIATNLFGGVLRSGPGSKSIKLSLAQFAGQDGLTMIFRSDQATTRINNVIVGFAERGERVGVPDEPVLSNGIFLFGDADATPPNPNATRSTRDFSLETYTFADGPRVVFDYEVFAGQLDVFVRTQFGIFRIATTDNQNRPQNVVLLVAGSPQRASLDLSQFAGQPGLSIIFRGRGDNTNGRVRIGAVTMELADGSRIFSGEPNPTYVGVPVPSTTLTRGAYQLEVRLGENYFVSNSLGAPTLTKSFDTNDRFAEQVTLVAPAGANVADGDAFEVNDGATKITFEFTTDGAVGLGNVPVVFAAADPDHVVARAIRNAINSPNIQTRLRISAATASGAATGTTGRDPRVNLMGNAAVKTVQSANPAGRVQVIAHAGNGDRNITREQSQMLIQNSYVREARDYSIWSEPSPRMQDPRDTAQAGLGGGFFFFQPSIQAKPALAGTQAVRNLPVLNESVQGGLLPGLVIQNNVLEEGGLGGINVQGENPIWMISPAFLPAEDNLFSANAPGNIPPRSHFGSYLDDGDLLVIDSDRTRLRFEFEDLAGGGNGGTINGASSVEGDGYNSDSSIAWFRDTGGSFYQRFGTPFATNGLETMQALRDSLLGSILVSNGTTQQVRATVAQSLLGPDPAAPPSSATQFYPEYFNRPAVFLEGVTGIEYYEVDDQGYRTTNGFNDPLDIRQLDLGESPQPHARIINNTIIGKDGRASFNGEAAARESNDTLSTAIQTWQGTAHNPLFYSDVGIIGDAGIGVGAVSSAVPTGGNGGGSTTTSASGSYNSNRFLMKFENGVSLQQQAQLISAQGLEIVTTFEFLNSVLVKPAGANDILTLDRLTGLEALPEVQLVEGEFFREIARVPNDPQFPQQWHYNNTGQTGGTVDADIDLPEAWDRFTGSSQTVIAVLDSGVDHTHPDLRANMWVNPGEIAGDGVDNDLNGYIDDIHGIDSFNRDSDPMDDNGHGTHVAGTTAAVGNNGTGVTGVSWNSKIMALKVGNAGGGISTFAVVEALNYMVMMKTRFGINIVVSNNSYGGGGSSRFEQNAVQASINAGISFVAAAGNSRLNNDLFPNFPSDYPINGIISVAATDDQDRLANFSNFGLRSVDLAAPGVGILSTTLGGGYGLNSGTSMASPHVAGVVALLAGAVPGASVDRLKAAILLGADPLPGLTNVTDSGARLNAAKSLFVLGAGLNGLAATDVDIYQFKLGIGERALVDIDSAGSGLNSVLQIFDSRGIPQAFVNANGVSTLISDNDAAPGEPTSVDAYADFTATAPGVYYAAVSSTGNATFDPLSFANRRTGQTTGAYRITISARHLQDFVINAEDASAYQAGETFTIFGVPDINGSTTSGRTFEFLFGFGAQPQPGNIPIHLQANWRFPDVARAIAKAINEGLNGGPAVANAQSLPNGIFGTASPLPPVHARAMGGLANILDADYSGFVGDPSILIDLLGQVDELGTNAVSHREIRRQLHGDFHEVNQGLEVFTRRLDGQTLYTTTTLQGLPPFLSVTSLSHMGFGHDRVSTVPISKTSIADGTSEKFVVINNAAWIDGNGTIVVSPDRSENNNLDQLLPETGILVSRGASPTILNNVFFNLQSPVINEESRRFPQVPPFTGGFAPYGSSNSSVVAKPNQIVLGGSVYQYDEPASGKTRYNTGVQQVPTNIPNVSLDFNFDAPDNLRLFVNAQAGQYLPAQSSILIDSGIDSLPERPLFASVKQAVGIPVSPVQAPDRDAVGLLRVDDPSVAPPSGLGQNVFKDRGALDRSDFVGPSAVLLDPVDNDSLGVDQDGAISVVQLASGIYSQFRIQLVDGNNFLETTSGIGIDDGSVSTAAVTGVRTGGSSVVLFENGRLLVEGIDYRFAYDTTRNEIILTPLAGVWRNDRVYEILLNNKNRFVVVAPSGDTIEDSDQMIIRDSLGGNVHFEFDSGFRLQIPQGLTLQVPLAGGQAGGVIDGDRFSISQGNLNVTFELDSNGNFLAGNIPIVFNSISTREDIANTIVQAIRGTTLTINPIVLPGGSVYLGSPANTRVNTAFSAITQPVQTLGIQVPSLGARPGGVTDGQRISISDGRVSIIFEFDTDGSSSPTSFRIDSSQASSASDIANLLAQAIVASGLKLQPRLIGSDVVHLGLSPSGSVNLLNSQLTSIGISRSIADGERFTITNGVTLKTFEFTTDATVGVGNTPIQLSLSETHEQLAERVEQAINIAGVGLQTVHINDGNISVGGTEQHVINVASAPSLGLFGTPGVASNTTLTIIGSLVLEVPARGGLDLVDDTTLVLSNNGQTLVIEFDGNFSGPTQPTNSVVRFSPITSVNAIVQSILNAINTSNLSIVATNLGGGRIDLGALPDSTVSRNSSAVRQLRGNVGDGQSFTIHNGVRGITFEFDNVSNNNGFTAGRVPILFSNASSRADVLSAMKAAIEAAGLGLLTQILSGSSIKLLDNPRYTFTNNAPTLQVSGVAGGATPILFAQDVNFTAELMKASIIRAINSAQDTSLVAKNRGGGTLFVENAISIDSPVPNFFQRAIEDLAGNDLRANRINDETQFTILMPGSQLDYGDAPDPLSTTNGRYPTQHVNDGARHALGQSVAILGASITAEEDGTPTPGADGDGTSDDGVVFGSALNALGVFNRNIPTTVTVTMTGAGFVDGWIDFNADGDWTDPGEQILSSVQFFEQSGTQSFSVQMPATAPVPNGPTRTYARFRSSSVGGLTPTGLAVDGEVEDYAVTIVPGTPPTPVPDTYTFNEDVQLKTVDPSGKSTPNFGSDDGVAANDTDPEGGTFSVVLVNGPANSQQFKLNSDGTFEYTPVADFNGTDTFTYRVSDGMLLSEAIGTVTLVVKEVNDVPIAVNDSLTINEDVTLTISEAELMANDLSGPINETAVQTIRVTGVQPTSKQGGSVSLVNGVITYIPLPDFRGADQFTYTITDNGTTNGLAAPLSATATVFLNVLDKNDIPIAGSDSLTVTEDSSGTIAVTTLLSNDSPGPTDEQTQTLRFDRVQPTSSKGGTVVLSSNGQSVIYTPAADFAGTDTFFYEISDNGLSGGVLDPQVGVGTVTVTVNPVNDQPRIANAMGTITVVEDSAARVVDLSTVFFDPDVVTNGDVLTYRVVSNSNAALVNPTVNGKSLTLLPAADRNGSSVIVVEARDQQGTTRTDTVTLIVTEVNDAPRLVQALPDRTVDEDVAPIQITLSPAFFFDPDVATNGDTLTFAIIENSNALLVTPTLSGGVLTLTLAADQSGSSQFTITGTDSKGQSISDSFLLIVNPVNDAPRTVADSYTVPQRGTLNATDARGIVGTPADDGVLANDVDVEGNTFTASVVTGPQFGTLTLNADGTFRYVHNGQNRTTDTFTYRANDGLVNSAVTTVTITIGLPLPSAHQNPTLFQDVNADGFISPIDALLIINYINSGAPSSVIGLPAPPPYRDVNGDDFISAIDALLVINELNRRSASGEGEASSTEFTTQAYASRVAVSGDLGYHMMPLVGAEQYVPISSVEGEANWSAGSQDWQVDLDWADVSNSADSDQSEATDEALAGLMLDLGINRKLND